MTQNDVIRNAAKAVRNPAQVRVNHVAAVEPLASDDGLTALVKMLRPMEAKAIHREWKENPLTKAMLGALRAMALHHPPMLDQAELAAQYGVTMGLVSALQLLDDPASMVPVFIVPAEGSAAAEDVDEQAEYTTPGV